jgi:hypothetical protein
MVDGLSGWHFLEVNQVTAKDNQRARNRRGQALPGNRRIGNVPIVPPASALTSRSGRNVLRHGAMNDALGILEAREPTLDEVRALLMNVAEQLVALAPLMEQRSRRDRRVDEALRELNKKGDQ